MIWPMARHIAVNGSGVTPLGRDDNCLSRPNDNSARSDRLVKTNKKMVWQLAASSVLACILLSCAGISRDSFVLQKIPIEIQSGKPVRIEIHSLSGNGVNSVGIRCSQEAWNSLTNGTKSIAVRLIS